MMQLAPIKSEVSAAERTQETHVSHAGSLSIDSKRSFECNRSSHGSLHFLQSQKLEAIPSIEPVHGRNPDDPHQVVQFTRS